MKTESLEKFVPDRINYYCKKYNITRYELSKRTGISQTALSNIAKYKQVPTLDTIEKICKGLNISATQFFITSDDIPGLSEDEKRILGFWGELSEDEKRFLEVILNNLHELKRIQESNV